MTKEQVEGTKGLAMNDEQAKKGGHKPAVLCEVTAAKT